MSSWGGKCDRCGSNRKQLFTSWYCPCEDFAFTLTGYGVINPQALEELETSGELATDVCFYVFKSKTDAKEFVAAFLGCTLIKVDMTWERPIFWSTKDELFVHKASRKLSYEVVQ